MYNTIGGPSQSACSHGPTLSLFLLHCRSFCVLAKSQIFDPVGNIEIVSVNMSHYTVIWGNHCLVTALNPQRCSWDCQVGQVGPEVCPAHPLVWDQHWQFSFPMSSFWSQLAPNQGFNSDACGGSSERWDCHWSRKTRMKWLHQRPLSVLQKWLDFGTVKQKVQQHTSNQEQKGRCGRFWVDS